MLRLLRAAPPVAFAFTLMLAPMTVSADEASAGTQPASTPPKAPDRWAPLRPLLGRWEGTSKGEPGVGRVTREYRLVLGDRFIEVRNRSAYAPTEKHPEGEVHEDLGYLSLDRARKVFVLRQFHVEGFVNTYTGSASLPPEPLTFTSEAIENIPPGWRARETYRFESPDVLVERFELAEPGKDFALYSESRLTRSP